MLKTESVFDASEKGAFIAGWGFEELAPGEVKKIEFKWDQIAASPDVLAEARELLYKNRLKNRVKARAVIVYSYASDDSKEEEEVIGKFVEINPVVHRTSK